MCSSYPLYSISNVQPHSHAFSFLTHNPISVRLTYAMRASFFATLVVAASAIFPALSTPLAYVVVPLNPAIPTDLFFVVYAVASLTSLRAISHLPHVTPPLSSRRGTAARTTALGALLLYVSPGLKIMRMTESLANLRSALCARRSFVVASRIILNVTSMNGDLTSVVLRHATTTLKLELLLCPTTVATRFYNFFG